MKMNFKILIKAGVICFLLLVMLIPLGFVKSTVSARLSYKKEAEQKITRSWGQELLVAAPLLNVPYQEKVVTKNEDKKEVITYKTSYYKYAPHTLITEAELAPQVRYIGIFKVPVFTAKVNMKGRFVSPEKKVMEGAVSFVSIELNNLKGIASNPILVWDGKKAEFENAVAGSPLRAQIPSTSYMDDYEYRHSSYDVSLRMLAAAVESVSGDIPFEISFDVRGSSSISFVPLAKDNKFTVFSSWRHPSFLGGFLPDTRTVDENGFKAQWNINSLSSGIAPLLNNYRGDLPTISVALMFPVDNYRNSERAVKYGILFIALTFLACFVFETVTKTPVHPFQYIMAGAAMAVFYLLLVSLSEFINFALAYAVSAAATIALLTAYIRYGIIKKGGMKTVWAAGLLTLLYVYLYILLRLEDLSLIFGTLGLFFGLAVMMYATRNINWYEE